MDQYKNVSVFYTSYRILCFPVEEEEVHKWGYTWNDRWRPEVVGLTAEQTGRHPFVLFDQVLQTKRFSTDASWWLQSKQHLLLFRWTPWKIKSSLMWMYLQQSFGRHSTNKWFTTFDLVLPSVDCSSEIEILLMAEKTCLETLCSTRKTYLTRSIE